MLSLSKSNFSLEDFGLIAAFNTCSMARSQFSVSCVIFYQKYSHQNCSSKEEPPRLNWGHKGVPLPWFSWRFNLSLFTFHWCTLREGFSFSWFGKYSRWFLMCCFFSSLQHTETDFKSRLKSRPELEELLAQVSWGVGEHSVHFRAIPGNVRLIFLSCSSLQKVDLVSSVLTRRNFHCCETSHLNKDKYICLYLTCLCCEWKGSTVKFGFIFLGSPFLVCFAFGLWTLLFQPTEVSKLIMIAWIAPLGKTAQI